MIKALTLISSAVIGLAAMPSPVRAEADVKTFLEYYDAGNTQRKVNLGEIVKNFEQGISWANVDMKENKLYCMPPHLILTPDQLVEMIRDEVKLHSDLYKLPFGLVLLRILKDTFPCPL